MSSRTHASPLGRTLRPIVASVVAMALALGGALLGTQAASAATPYSEVKYGTTFSYNYDTGVWSVTNTDNAQALKDIDSTQAVLCSNYDTGLGLPCTNGATYTLTSTATPPAGFVSCAYVQGDGGGNGPWDTVPGDPGKRVCAPELVPDPPKKVFVCKYVGTPGVDERLQTGQNPISVSVNSIQNNQWDGTVPGYFSDAHDRSYVLAYDTGQPEPDVSACPAPVEPECVDNPDWSYTFNEATGSGSITVGGGDEGDTLCEPLYVRATTWKYVPPASGSPSWPQTLYGYNDLTVSEVGSFDYSPPQLAACRQYDIYASFGGFGDLAVPSYLIGSHNPSEPAFLHETLSGKGPNPTYSYTNSSGCGTPPPPGDDVCVVSSDTSTPAAPNGWFSEYGTPTFTDTGVVLSTVSVTKMDYVHATSTPLADIDSLGYSVTNLGPSGTPTASFQLTVLGANRLDGTPSGFTTLVWEPYRNGHAIDASGDFTDIQDGYWWSTRPILGANGQSDPQLLSTILANNPNIVPAFYRGNLGTGNDGATSEIHWMEFDCKTTYPKANPTVVPADPGATIVKECGAATVTLFNTYTPGVNTVGSSSTLRIREDGVVVVTETVDPNEDVPPFPFSYPEDSGDHLLEVLDENDVVVASAIVGSDCEPNRVNGAPDIDVQEQCGAVTFTFSYTANIGKHEYADPITFVYTDANGDTQEVEMEANDPDVVRTVSFAEDSGSHTVSYGVKGEELAHVTVLTDCLPNIPLLPPTGMVYATALTQLFAGLLAGGLLALCFAYGRPWIARRRGVN